MTFWPGFNNACKGLIMGAILDGFLRLQNKDYSSSIKGDLRSLLVPAI